MAATGSRPGSGFEGPNNSPKKKAKTTFGEAKQQGRFTVVTYSRALWVLVVENDGAQRVNLTLKLDDLDIPNFTHEALNGREAVNMCGRRAYDVIFIALDTVLDGNQATRELRANGFTAPIIGMLSAAAASDNARVNEFLESGVNECLTKLISNADLERILTMAWNGN